MTNNLGIHSPPPPISSLEKFPESDCVMEKKARVANR